MIGPTGSRTVPLDSAALGLAGVEHEISNHLGRPCISFADVVATVTLPDVALDDGVVEADLAVAGQRAFHGVIWRVQDADAYESFFVRPHQVGNPDAIQYTPVTNGISSWQLYHGPGFWAPIAFPIGPWFTIRVAFAGARADVYVGDLISPALQVAELKRPPASGGIGLLVGGPGLRLGRFAYDPARPDLSALATPPDAIPSGVIRTWDVSDPFVEADLDGTVELPSDLVASRSWTPLAAEPSGLLDLSRAHGIRDGRNTVLVRTTIDALRAVNVPLQLGFSDRAIVFLNGQALFRGDDSYRSRDYRFLGSIGFWDTVFLPLRDGANDLLVAVSEDLGGWGVQARFAEGGERMVRVRTNGPG